MLKTMRYAVIAKLEGQCRLIILTSVIFLMDSGWRHAVQRRQHTQ